MITCPTCENDIDNDEYWAGNECLNCKLKSYAKSTLSESSNAAISFSDPIVGKEVARIWFENDGKLRFSGNVNVAGKELFKYLQKYVDEYISNAVRDLSFFNWVDKFCKQLENAEKPSSMFEEYEIGYLDGEKDTQDFIAGKLRFAIEEARKNL